MRNMCVMDCSFASAFFLGEAEGERFGDIYKRYHLHGEGVHVPALFTFEIMNVFLSALRRKRITQEDAITIRQDLHFLKFTKDNGPSERQVETIFELADRHKLTFYDASYLELAIRHKADLKTLDKDLLKLKDEFSWISDH